jgi:acyl-CoA thioester hydrolase
MLENYPVTVDIPVRWADIDSLGHVNNVVYHRYFEIARIAYLERLGLQPPGLDWGEQGLIIASVSCCFKAPVTYPDTLTVGSRVTAIEEDRLIIDNTAVSQKLGRVVAVGDAEMVCYDYVEGHRSAMPEDWRRRIAKLEGHELSRNPPTQDPTITP